MIQSSSTSAGSSKDTDLRSRGTATLMINGVARGGYAFGKRCREAGVMPSMGSVGNAYDNAMAESFFATLERELLSSRRFRSQAEAKLAVFEWIEGWYNPHRRHSSLGYRSPSSGSSSITCPSLS
jgi:transposase InsO family protein